jgi:hypothetical protein
MEAIEPLTITSSKLLRIEITAEQLARALGVATASKVFIPTAFAYTHPKDKFENSKVTFIFEAANNQTDGGDDAKGHSDR